jgi:hypothetical protein
MHAEPAEEEPDRSDKGRPSASSRIYDITKREQTLKRANTEQKSKTTGTFSKETREHEERNHEESMEKT